MRFGEVKTWDRTKFGPYFTLKTQIKIVQSEAALQHQLMETPNGLIARACALPARSLFSKVPCGRFVRVRVRAGRCAGSGLLPSADLGAAAGHGAPPSTCLLTPTGWEIFHLEGILFPFPNVKMELPDGFERRSSARLIGSQDAE